MASIEKFPRTKALDFSRLEADVTAALPALPIRAAPSVHSEPLPDYVEHREGVSRVGALTAEARDGSVVGQGRYPAVFRPLSGCCSRPYPRLGGPFWRGLAPAVRAWPLSRR